MCINGKRMRKGLLNKNMKILDLQTEFAKYEERKNIAIKITNIFTGTEYEGFISQIVDMVISISQPKQLYITSLKSFGRKSGTEVYRKLKVSAIDN